MTGDLVSDGDSDDAVNATDAGDDDEEDVEELVSMAEGIYYFEHVLRLLAATHSLVAFSMLVAYYCLKVIITCTLTHFMIPWVKYKSICV